MRLEKYKSIFGLSLDFSDVCHVLSPGNPWINWDTICSVKECDGLRIRRTREFNIALLDKWC